MLYTCIQTYSGANRLTMLYINMLCWGKKQINKKNVLVCRWKKNETLMSTSL